MIFEFDSGGAGHPEGFGAWRVRVDGDRAEFEHRVRDRVTRYPAVTLPRSELTILWELVDGASLDKRFDTKRPPEPDEPLFTFGVAREANARLARTQLRPSQSDDAVRRLVEKIAELIEKYIGQRPVLL